MKKRIFIAAAVAAATTLLASALLTGAAAGGRPLSADLDPVPTASGSGTADLTLNQGLGTVCWDISLTGVDPLPHMGHIHDLATNGVILTLFGMPPNSGGATTPSTPTAYPASACVEGVSAELIKELRQNAGAYYVNLHNSEFPGGVVQGTLSK